MNRLSSIAIAAILVGCSTSTPPPAPEASVVEVASAETLSLDTDAPAPPVVAEAPESLASVEAPTPEGTEDAVSAEPDVPLTRFSLRRGETLAHFARWSELPVEDIAHTSELDLDGVYAVGTEIALELDADGRARVESRRDAHHQVRAEHYLASRGATGTEFYAVRTGDSAWSIARDRHGMPVWLLESLNPSASLDRLRPGQELLVPVFNDIVVEAPEGTPSADGSDPDDAIEPVPGR